MDFRYTSSQLWTELHKKQSFLKKTGSRSAPQQMSCLLGNSRLIKQQLNLLVRRPL